MLQVLAPSAVPIFDTHCHIGVWKGKTAYESAVKEHQEAVGVGVNHLTIVGIDAKTTRQALFTAMQLRN